MATMIPAQTPDKTPYSEKVVFDRIQSDPQTSDWVVLHSVGLAKTNRGPYGEIDYVILIPGKGIVCLEIKGGLVHCSNGIWTTTNQKTNQTSILKISPYMQAREGMFSLKRAIEDHFGSLDPASRCPLSYAVVFPAVDSLPRTPGEEVWETIDNLDLQRPISTKILQNINGARKKLTIPLKAESVSIKTMSAIRQYLRPDFDRIATRASTIRQSEERLVALTEAQYNYLDIAEQNERLIVEGAAGTGKTVLAIEHARREASAKRKTLLLCFNRVLASWLGRQFSEEEKKLIQVVSFYSLVRKLIGESDFLEEFEAECAVSTSEDSYSRIYPFYGELALSDRDGIADSLIVDEAQDLITESNLPVINLLVSKTMSNGRWVMFGDFAYQTIYTRTHGKLKSLEIKSLLTEYSGSITNIPLKVNCRNTRQIGEETALLSGFDSLPYRLANAEGLPVDYRYWKAKEDEQEQLVRVLTMLLEEGVQPEDIVILAPSRYENSIVSSLLNVRGVPISDLGDIAGEPGKCIVFSTIHAFKGMESPVIVLCGISGISSNEEKALLYVGMSRARSQLIVIGSDKIKKTLPELTLKRLTEGWQT